EEPRVSAPSRRQGSRPDVAAGHEERDVSVRPIAIAVFGLAVVCVLAGLAMQILFNLLAAQQSRQSAAPSPLAGVYGWREPPERRLQPEPKQDLDTLRARDAAVLEHYGWVDRDAGVVRIPVERAIEVLAARGLPARAKPEPRPQKDQP